MDLIARCLVSQMATTPDASYMLRIQLDRLEPSASNLTISPASPTH